MEIPENIMAKIREVAGRKGYAEEELVEYYMEIYRDEWIQSLPEEVRHEQTLKIMLSRVITRPPLKKYEIIPIGYSPLNKDGKRSVLYALVKGRSGIQRILCRDKYAKIWEHINLFTLYEVKLETFSDGGLATDVRSKWDNGKVLDIPPEKLLEKIPKITIAEAPAKKSLISSTGYVNDTDWRCIRAIITRRNVSRDGRLAVYNIWDDTVPYDEIVLPDGTVVPPGMTVWCNPNIARWEVDSECLFFGDVRVDENGLAFMNAYLILPIIAKEVEVESDES